MREHHIKDDIEEIKEDMAKLRSDMSNLAKKLIEIGKSDTGDIKEKLEAEARSLLDNFLDEVDEIQERGKKAAETVEKEFKERPLLSIVIAFIVGFIIGKLFERR